MPFSKFVLPWKGQRTISDFGCTSIGTYFTTSENRTYIIGDVVSAFTRKSKTENHALYILDWKNVFSSIADLNLDGNRPNHIVPGGWFYCFCYKPFNEGKYETHFRTQLGKLVNYENNTDLSSKNIFHDITVIH